MVFHGRTQQMENNEVTPEVLPNDAVPEVSTEAKVKLLTDWIDSINSDIAIMNEARKIEYGEYQKLKATTDKWLVSRMKKVNCVDKKINERRKAIKEIETEIANIRNRPPPGVLPPLPPPTPRVFKPKKVEIENVSEVDLSKIEFTPEERAAMNAAAQTG